MNFAEKETSDLSTQGNFITIIFIFRLLGLYGFTFVDFGDAFKIFDQNGEELKPCLVSNITKEEEGVVFVHEDKKHPFQDGDYVTFKEVEGMTEINNKQFQVKVNF